MNGRFKRVSVAEGKQSLPRLLREAEDQETAIMIYRRDRLAGAIVGPLAFERLMRLQAYVDALRLSAELGNTALNAMDLARAARQEVESRS